METLWKLEGCFGAIFEVFHWSGRLENRQKKTTSKIKVACVPKKEGILVVERDHTTVTLTDKSQWSVWFDRPLIPALTCSHQN